MNEAEAVFCGNCGASLAPVDVDNTVVIPGASKPAAEADPTPTPEPAEAPDPKPAATPDPGPQQAKPAPPPDPAPPQPKPIPAPDPTPILDANSVACSNCGTINPAARSFCRKCANPLRAMPVARRSRGINRDLASKFLVAAVVSTVVVVGGAMLVTRLASASVARPSVPPPVTITDQTGVSVPVGLVPGDNPQPLQQLPANVTVQLASYDEAAQETTAPDGTVRAIYNVNSPGDPSYLVVPAFC